MLLQAIIDFPLFDRARLGIGAETKYTATELEDSPFLDSLRPYGVADAALAKVGAEFTFDTRNGTSAPENGVFLNLRGKWFPEMFDNLATFRTMRAEARTYLTATAPLRTTLALRAGGEKIWGRFPYFESVFLGGSRSLRGYEENRFAGSAALWGNAELRMKLFDYRILVPGSVGVMGLADAGRVWLNGEEADEWHTAYGGGLTVSFVKPENVLVLSVVHSKEKNISLYAGFGFAF